MVFSFQTIEISTCVDNYKNITVYMKTRSFLLCGLYHLLLNLGTIGLTSTIMSEKYN